MKFVTVVLIGISLVTVGCSREQAKEAATAQPAVSAPWQTITPEDMTEAQKAQYEQCLTATNALAAELMGELSAALDAGDTAAAIATCRTKAPAIASGVGTDFGVKIGRTSFKLRNPANVPPEWAKDVVAKRLAEPTYLVGPDGEFGAMLPIRLKAACQMCHGAPDAIDPAVLAAIKEQYPEDQAVGFSEGDLRGWFWVEVPPQAETAPTS